MRKFLMTAIVAAMVLCSVAVWGEETGQLNLEDCIKMGLEKSPLTKINDQELKKADIAVRKAAAGLWPAISFSGNVTKSYDYVDLFDMSLIESMLSKINDPAGNPDPIIPQAPIPYDATTYTAKVNINQVLFSQAVFKAYTVSKLFYGQQRFTWQKNREDLVLNVVNTYLSALKAQYMYEFNKANVEQRQKYLKMAQARYNVGLASKSDVLQMEVALATAQNTLIRSDIGAKTALLALKNLLGIPVDQQITLTEVPLPALADLPEPKTMLTEALDKRCDYLAGELVVKLNEINVSINKGAYWPNLNLSASYGQDRVSKLTTDGNKWTLTVALNWNIWDGGKTNAAIDEAKANLIEAETQQEMSKQKIELDLVQTYLNNDEIRQRLALCDKAVEQAEENLRLAEKSYQEGLFTATALDDARLSLENAKLNQIQTRFDAALFDYSMRKARGIMDVE